MKFLVCPTGPSQLKYQDTDGCFQSNSGTFFDYQVEFIEDEMITITDNIGRSVPIDIFDVAGMARMLTRIAQYTEDKAACQEDLMAELCYGAES